VARPGNGHPHPPPSGPGGGPALPRLSLPMALPSSSRSRSRACRPCRLVARRSALPALRPPCLGVLRLLRGQGRHPALQRLLPGGAGAGRRAHRAHHEQRLPRTAERVRPGGPGADRAGAGSDPRRQPQAARAPRRLPRAAAGGVLRPRPCMARALRDGEVSGAHGDGRRLLARGAPATGPSPSASPSRLATRSASTTS
jgi:hypothetical protein